MILVSRMIAQLEKDLMLTSPDPSPHPHLRASDPAHTKVNNRLLIGFNGCKVMPLVSHRVILCKTSGWVWGSQKPLSLPRHSRKKISLIKFPQPWDPLLDSHQPLKPSSQPRECGIRKACLGYYRLENKSHREKNALKRKR